jgi:hypothetical protein
MQNIVKLLILIAPVIAFLFYFSKTKKSSLLSVLASIYLILIISITLFSIGKDVYSNYHQPPKWDFLSFWINGKIGLTGNNFYDVKNYQRMSLPYDPGDDFRKEIIDVGFWYPPFSVFLFLPLGLFEISHAYLLWQISNLLLCMACIYGIWRYFLKDYGVLSLFLIATLMLRLEPTRSTFSFAQTNFLALLFFLLFWRNRSKKRGGIWLACCVVVKPYMALFYIYPLLTRKWKVLTVAILTLLALILLSVAAFGADNLVSYFTENPTSKMPACVYSERVNQSLLATILRLTPNLVIKGSPLLNPLYVGISLILIFTTVLVIIKNRSNDDDWVFLSILFLALIVYPATLAHYGVFLIIPVALLLQRSSQSVKKRIIILLALFITYLFSGSFVFLANIFMWLVCIVLGTKIKIGKSEIAVIDA